MVAMSISLWYVIACSLVVSSVLASMNSRGVGLLGAAGAAAIALVALVLIDAIGSGTLPLSRQTTWVLGLCILFPSTVLIAVSRLAVFHTYPWMLLVAGPIAFVVAVVMVMIAYNMLFAGSIAS
jgi:hypothetical protein